jgi:hypothetical protein
MRTGIQIVFACAGLLLSFDTPAKTDIIHATFTGTVTGGVAGTYHDYATGLNHLESSLIGLPFTALYTFDTTKGVLSHPSPETNDLRNGLIGPAILTIDGLGTFNFWGDIGHLLWTLDQSLIVASAFGDGYNQLDSGFLTAGYIGGWDPSVGFFQTGTCPGLPCGTLHIDTSILGTPGPIAGAGFPGLLLLGAAILAWRRRMNTAR